MEDAFYGLFRFFRALGGPAVAIALAFATPEVRRDGADVVVSGRLEGAITPAVRDILDTGTPVELRYEGRLTSAGAVRTARDRAVLRRDPLTGAWTVNGSVHPTREAALARASSYRLRFTAPGKGSLRFRVEASIHHPPGLSLAGAAAALWDHRVPYLEIRHLERMMH